MVMYFCIQNTDIAPERNERRLCRKGIEPVRIFKKEREKKKVQKGTVCCSLFRFLS